MATLARWAEVPVAMRRLLADEELRTQLTAAIDYLAPGARSAGADWFMDSE